jgi:hypothetical protein
MGAPLKTEQRRGRTTVSGFRQRAKQVEVVRWESPQ